MPAGEHCCSVSQLVALAWSLIFTSQTGLPQSAGIYVIGNGVGEGDYH